MAGALKSHWSSRRGRPRSRFGRFAYLSMTITETQNRCIDALPAEALRTVAPRRALLTCRVRSEEL